eukprot:jgi/Galph1/5117/GphlegSOOS_G3699.1
MSFSSLGKAPCFLFFHSFSIRQSGNFIRNLFSREFSMQSAATVSSSWDKSKFHEALLSSLEDTKKSGTYKSERVIKSPQGSKVEVEGVSAPVLNFCANNYLGLANHPRIVESAKRALGTHGFGMASVRFICGTQDLHKLLERKISEFHRTEDTIVFPSCFDANAGFFEAILTSDDAVLSDELNHASIIDGIRLCKAQKHRYKHLDMKDLSIKLRETQNSRVRLIVTDGVFSMDGDIAPLQEICSLADKFDAYVFIDECHATGFLGKTGIGTSEFWNIPTDRIIAINSTLGKALGGATGGFTTGKKAIVDTLKQKARPYLFSNTLAPVVAAASLTVFDILSSSEGQQLRDRLWGNTKKFRSLMAQAGFEVRGGLSGPPIVPVMIGDAGLATQMANEMLTEHGIYVIGFSYPVVPQGKARIRVQLSAVHSNEDIEKLVKAFVSLGQRHGLLQKNKL